jgi:enterochelin esterase-like enzyme
MSEVSDTLSRSSSTSEISEEGCQIDRFTLRSESMQRDIKVVVVLPPGYLHDNDQQFPILYTLHGYGAPYDTWAQMRKLQQQLKEKPFIYACFDGDIGSCYIDSTNKINVARETDKGQVEELQLSYFRTFFFDEFMPAIDQRYRTNPDKRGLTGFSMGGGGSLTYMLDQPDLFCSVSGLSTAYFNFDSTESRLSNRLAHYIGSKEENPEAYERLDHYKAIKRHLDAGTQLPPIYQHIGTEDFLLEENREFNVFAEANGLDLIYRETDGAHNWAFWHPASVEVAEFHWDHFRQ